MVRLLIFGAVVFACLFVVLADDGSPSHQKNGSGKYVFDRSNNHGLKGALKAKGLMGRKKVVTPTKTTTATTPESTKAAKRFAPGSNKQCINTCLNTCNTAQMALGCGFCKLPNSKCYDANSVCSATASSTLTCQCKAGFQRSGSSCVACPAGSVSISSGASCASCPSNSIVVSNVCTACVSPAVPNAARTACGPAG